MGYRTAGYLTEGPDNAGVRALIRSGKAGRTRSAKDTIVSVAIMPEAEGTVEYDVEVEDTLIEAKEMVEMPAKQVSPKQPGGKRKLAKVKPQGLTPAKENMGHRARLLA